MRVRKLLPSCPEIFAGRAGKKLRPRIIRVEIQRTTELVITLDDLVGFRYIDMNKR